jgi:hypothetical protein
VSTRVTLKVGTVGDATFHLSDDVLDELLGIEDPPVYLRIDGVHAEMQTMAAGGASVSLVLPRALARQMGLFLDLDPPGAVKKGET